MNHHASPITRRDALARLTLLLGGALIGGEAWLRGSPPAGKMTNLEFSTTDLALLDEIGETIIPTTDTPGAKATGIGAFMVMMVNDCYDDRDHAAFHTGLAKINAASQAKFGQDFISATPVQRTTLLNELDAEQKRDNATKAANEPAHYFRMMKQLTLLGYFTSEIGATQALRFIEVPASFDGSKPYKKGDRAWFGGPSRSI